jgi:hypothetical protein
MALLTFLTRDENVRAGVDEQIGNDPEMVSGTLKKESTDIFEGESKILARPLETLYAHKFYAKKRIVREEKRERTSLVNSYKPNRPLHRSLQEHHGYAE